MTLCLPIDFRIFIASRKQRAATTYVNVGLFLYPSASPGGETTAPDLIASVQHWISVDRFSAARQTEHT